jgi:hypothetical protein
MAEYCDTPQSKERSNGEYKVCLNESAILRLLDQNYMAKKLINDQWIKNPLPQNDNSCENKDLQEAEKGVYKPAYKKNPETTLNTAKNLPQDLAELMAA